MSNTINVIVISIFILAGIGLIALILSFKKIILYLKEQVCRLSKLQKILQENTELSRQLKKKLMELGK